MKCDFCKAVVEELTPIPMSDEQLAYSCHSCLDRPKPGSLVDLSEYRKKRDLNSK